MRHETERSNSNNDKLVRGEMCKEVMQRCESAANLGENNHGNSATEESFTLHIFLVCVWDRSSINKRLIVF